MQKVLAVSKEQMLMYFESSKQLAGHIHSIFAKRIMEVVPNRRFYILMIESTNAAIHVPRNMVTGKSSNKLLTAEIESFSRQSQINNQQNMDTVNLS